MTSPDTADAPGLPAADPALLDFAVELVQDAGKLTLQWFQDTALTVERKSDGSPVTAADRAAERLVRERIGERFPDDGVLGEEEPESAGTSGRRWIVDPIDGTKAFTRGVPLYSTLLALDDEHGPAIGVIGLPATGQVVYAGRGLGCFADGRPTHVSDRARLSGAYLTSSGFSHWPEDALLGVKRAGCELRTWGDGYGYAMVATGRADVMVDPIVATYDVAAMPVILSEAGGRFTDLGGRPGADGGSGLATNGLLHEGAMALLTDAIPGQAGE